VISAGGAQAQKPGGVLRIYHRDSPASISMPDRKSSACPMTPGNRTRRRLPQHLGREVEAQNSLRPLLFRNSADRK
jgi:hypothetical protein